MPFEELTWDVRAPVVGECIERVTQYYTDDTCHAEHSLHQYVLALLQFTQSSHQHVQRVEGLGVGLHSQYYLSEAHHWLHYENRGVKLNPNFLFCYGARLRLKPLLINSFILINYLFLALYLGCSIKMLEIAIILLVWIHSLTHFVDLVIRERVQPVYPWGYVNELDTK